MSEPRSVLVIGLDPHALAGWESDADAVAAAINRGQARFDDYGIRSDLCLVAPDETAESEIIEQLGRKDYSCVVIGGGIRTHEPLLEFFETVINLVHRHAPEAAIAFNASRENSVEAAMRWLPVDR